MKRKNCCSTFTQERDEDLHSTYIELLSKAVHIHLPTIMNELVNMPSRRFWVSEDRASIVIKNIIRGDDLSGMNPLRREMFLEIYRRCNILKSRDSTKSFSQIISEVLEQPAPKFYLTPLSAKVLLSRHRKRKRLCLEKKKEQLRYIFM